MIDFKQIGGPAVETFQKAIGKMEREHRKEIAGIFKKNLREAVTFGRRLISLLFFGKGRRLQRAFRQQVRISPDDVIGRVGYLMPESKRGKGVSGRFARQHYWWLGRIYESGATIRNRKNSRKKVWIPIGANRKASGAPVVTPSQYFATLKGQSFIRTGPSGHPVAFRSTGGEIVPMFVLKHQIKIKPRPVVIPSTDKYVPIIVTETGERLGSYFRGMKKGS